MPSVGTAYVNIRVNTKGFEAGLDKMLARLSKKMEAGGKKLGDDMAKGMKSSNVEKFFRDMELRAQTASTKMANDFKKVEGALDNVGLTASDAGDMVNSSFAKVSPTLKGVRGDLKEVSGAAKDVDRDSRGASRSLSGLSGAGRGVRSAANDVGFFRGILNKLSKDGVGVRSMLSGLHDQFAIMGTGVSSLIGGLSSVGQGLFAVGSQAAAAAPSLGIFATGLIGIAQVGGVLAISMHGVGEAITAGFKSTAATANAAAGATKGLGDATAAAARAVRDAKQALQNAYRDAARSAEDAARRTADAEKTLAAATVATAQAQKDLNASFAAGREELRQIGFAAEQASIDQSNAALALQDAQDAAAAASDLAKDDPVRVKALLDLKQAELNYREAKDASKESDKDSAKAAKEGVKGTDAVTTAQQALTDAQNSQNDAAKSLADARREEARTAQDNAQNIADAQQSLADAEKGLADARKKGTKATTAATTAADAYNAALKKLSPNQQKFVKALIKLGPQFKAARNQIADPLFGGLLSALDTLSKSTLWDQVVNQLTTTSSTLGDLIDKGATAATQPPFSTALLGAMKSNNRALTPFAESAGNLANAFVQIADASGPVLVDFAQWTKKVTGAWSQTATMDNKTGKLDATIKRAGDRVGVFKDFFVQLWTWLRKVGGAATDASEKFKWTKDGASKRGYIPMLTEHLKEFNDQLDHGKMVDDFHTALVNMSAAGRAVKSAVVDPLLALGRDKRLAGAFNTIGDSDAFTRLAGSGGEAAQALADLVVDVADIAATLSESGSFATFIGDLDKVANVISGFLDKVPLPVLKTLGTVLGTLAAIRVTTTIGTKLVAALTPPGLDKLPGRVRKIAPKIAEAGASVQTAGKDIAAGFQLSLAEGFKEVGRTGFTAAKSAFTKIKTAIGEDDGAKAGRDLMAGISLGIEAGLEGVIAASTEAGKAIIAAMKRAMGERSPSTITTQAGRDLMTGLTLGIEEGEAGAIAAGEQAGLATGAAVKEGAAVGGAGAGAGAGGAAGGLGALGGAAGGEVGKVGKFAGIFGKFSKVLGPATKLMKPLSLGIRAVGGAFRFAMGPVGMIVLTLLPILWPLLVKLEKKTGIFSKTLDVLTGAFEWLWEKIQDLFDWVKQNWPLLLTILTGPFGLAVVAITKNWDKIWGAIKFVWDWIKKNWKLLLAILTGPIGLAVRYILRHWGKIVDFVKGLPEKFHRFLDKLWAPVGDRLSDAWATVQRIWARIVTWVKYRPTQFRINMAKIWDVFTDKLADAWTSVQNKWTSIKTAIGRWPNQMGNLLKGLFNGMGQGIIDAENFIGTKVNWLIGKINGLSSKFGGPTINFTLPTDRVFTGFAEGGPVRGPGGPVGDRILARLSDGEYVQPASAVRAIGQPAMDYMRKYGELPPAMGDIGGFFSGAVHKAESIGSAIGHGMEFALKWALGKASESLTGHGFLSDLVISLLRNMADDITGFGATKDASIAAAAIKAGGASVDVSDPSNPRGLTSWHGGTFTRRFVAHLQKAQKIAGAQIVVIQGGFRPATSFSGTSHQGDAIDTAVVYSVLRALRSVGIAAGDRTGLGHWMPHIHAIPGPKAGYGAGSAVWQWQDYMARGGAKQSPRSPWGLATGGVVAPSSMGTLALLAEAGKSERVTPLDSQGFTPAERAMLERLDASMGGGGGDTYNVHPAPGMDETALADKVARRVAWNRRRGTGRR